MPLKEKQKIWVDTFFPLQCNLTVNSIQCSDIRTSAFDLLLLSKLNLVNLQAPILPDHESWCWCSEFKTEICYQHNCVLWEVFKCSVDNSATSVSCVYLSVSDLVGGGADFVGDDTGLVSAWAPFRREVLTSAILQWCTGTWFCLFKWVFDYMDRTLI